MVVGIAKYNKGMRAKIVQNGYDYTIVKLANGKSDAWCKGDYIKETKTMSITREFTQNVALFLIGILLTVVGIHYIQNDFRGATVAEIKGDVITFETTDGNLWDYKTSETYEIGEMVVLEMFDFENMNPYDDQIVKVRREK